MKNETLGTILKCKSFGTFKNDNNEYCRVSTWYERNTKKIQIIFAKEGEIAQKYAVSTTSEKKCIKILVDGGYKLENA